MHSFPPSPVPPPSLHSFRDEARETGIHLSTRSEPGSVGERKRNPSDRVNGSKDPWMGGQGSIRRRILSPPIVRSKDGIVRISFHPIHLHVDQLLLPLSFGFLLFLVRKGWIQGSSEGTLDRTMGFERGILSLAFATLDGWSEPDCVERRRLDLLRRGWETRRILKG